MTRKYQKEEAADHGRGPQLLTKRRYTCPFDSVTRSIAQLRTLLQLYYGATLHIAAYRPVQLFQRRLQPGLLASPQHSQQRVKAALRPER